jgi:hypothetical protein
MRKNTLFYSFIQSEMLSQTASVRSAAVVFVMAIRSRIFTALRDIAGLLTEEEDEENIY